MVVKLMGAEDWSAKWGWKMQMFLYLGCWVGKKETKARKGGFGNLEILNQATKYKMKPLHDEGGGWYITSVQTTTNAPYPIPNCEVKRRWGDWVLWWVTTWETSTDACKQHFLFASFCFFLVNWDSSLYINLSKFCWVFLFHPLSLCSYFIFIMCVMCDVILFFSSKIQKWPQKSPSSWTLSWMGL